MPASQQLLTHKACRLKKAEKEKMKEMAAAAESQDKEARRKARKYVPGCSLYFAMCGTVRELSEAGSIWIW